MTRDLLSTLDQLPPWQVRLLALSLRRPVSTRALAEKSGLSVSTIKVLTRADSWLPFEMRTIIRFTKACGVDLLHQKYPKQRLRNWMRASRGPVHLSTSQRKYWNSVFTGEKQWRKPAV